MARLKLLLAWLLSGFFTAVPADAAGASRWAGQIAEASARFGIPQAWIRRVIAAESGGRTMLAGRPIESRAGAMGLMQLMPGTWRAMRAAHGLGSDPHDPRDNILAGTAYLRLMYDRFGYPGLFAAYNAGPGAYAAYLAGRRRLPAETRAYLAEVAPAGAGRDAVRPGGSRPGEAAPALAQGSPPSLFAIRLQADRLDAGATPTPPARSGDSLFIRLRTNGR